jgi:hypothetical protein
MPAGRNRRAILDKKNLRCQLLHSFFTNHAQVFHNGEARRRQEDGSSRNPIQQVE